MARRRRAVEGLLAEAGCDHLVFCGANRFGSAVQWLTLAGDGRGGRRAARRASAMRCSCSTTITCRRRGGSRDEADVAWGGQSSIARGDRGTEEARRAGGPRRDDRPLSAEQHAALTARSARSTNLNKRLRAAAHDEVGRGARLAAHRRAFHRSRHGGAARRHAAGARPNASSAICRARLRGAGGTNVIHYFGVTPMHDPQIAVPAQFPSTRRVQAGDIVFAEISAAFWDYPGQVLRSFAVGESRRRSIATCTRPPMRRSTRSRPCWRRRHAGAGDRGRARDRGCGLHHHRRSAARLWRRLSAADPRAAPAGRPGRCRTSRSAPA